MTDLLEEAGRRLQETTAVIQHRVDEFERFVELVDQRAGRTAEGLRRYEQELTRLSGELEVLHKQDGVAGERLQVYAEVFKRLEEEIALVAQQTDVRREFSEKLDLYRANFRQMSAPYTQILSAERSLIQIEDDYVAQLIVAWQSVAEIEGLLAGVN